MASPYTIPCGHCGAKAGKRCTNTFTGAFRSEPHRTRVWDKEHDHTPRTPTFADYLNGLEDPETDPSASPMSAEAVVKYRPRIPETAGDPE